MSLSHTNLLEHVQIVCDRTESNQIFDQLSLLLQSLQGGSSSVLCTSIAQGDDEGRCESSCSSVDHKRYADIDFKAIRVLAAQGVPDEVPALRAAVWKLLLGYLPVDASQWDTTLAESRASYMRFIEELLADAELAEAPGAPHSEGKVRDNVSGVAEDEGAQNNVKHRQASQHITEVFDQIHKDVLRTRPELLLFSMKLDEDRDKTFQCRGEEEQGGSSEVYNSDPEFSNVWKPVTHGDLLARMLLLYAKLNPGVQYVQGMNELCAPFYYLFLQDPLNHQHVEADAFFCFNLLMSDMRETFVKSLDHEQNGMIGRVQRLSSLLKEKDQELWNHLDNLQVQPVFYAVRWLTLMLTQDHEMPDILRVWDSLLSESPFFLIYICAARLILVRSELLSSDFAACVKLLQNYPSIPVSRMLNLAKELLGGDRIVPKAAESNALSRLHGMTEVFSGSGSLRERVEARAQEALARIEGMKKRQTRLFEVGTNDGAPLGSPSDHASRSSQNQEQTGGYVQMDMAKQKLGEWTSVLKSRVSNFRDQATTAPVQSHITPLASLSDFLGNVGGSRPTAPSTRQLMPPLDDENIEWE